MNQYYNKITKKKIVNDKNEYIVDKITTYSEIKQTHKQRLKELNITNKQYVKRIRKHKDFAKQERELKLK